MCVALTIVVENEVSDSNGVAGNILASEFGGHSVLLP